MTKLASSARSKGNGHQSSGTAAAALKHAVAVRPRTGNQANLRRLQAKLTVGAVNDPLEQEADAAADRLMRMADPRIAHSAPPTLSRKCAQEETQDALQRKAGDGAMGGEAAPPIVNSVLASPGRALDPATHDFMASRFGTNFSDVRIHTGAEAAQSAAAVGARAYTVGRDVVFGAGQYEPAGNDGRRLLAHELAHVVQQRQAFDAQRLTVGEPVTNEPILALRRSNGALKPSVPSPPDWLGPLKSGATNIEGNVWDVQIKGLGLTPVGPYDELQAYLRKFNLNRGASVESMEAAHLIGGEHMADLGWTMAYEKAPCVGVAESLHDKWTREISNLQSKAGPMGGRATPTSGRPTVGPRDVKALYDEVYKGFPDLQKMSKRIIDLETDALAAAEHSVPAVKPPTPTEESPPPDPAVEAPTAAKPPAAEAPSAEAAPTPTTTPEAPTGGVVAPEVPVPKGGVRATLSRIRSGFTEGVLEGSIAPEAIAAEVPYLVLYFADRAAARDAIRNIQVKFAKEGFARGYAAGVAGWSESEVHSDLKNRVTAFRVEGLADEGGYLKLPRILQLAEATENYAVDLGFARSSRLGSRWKQKTLEWAYAKLDKDGYLFSRDERVRYTYEFIDKLAWELSPTTNQIVQRGIKWGD
jgi:Domain of unknown function (DUF4157)